MINYMSTTLLGAPGKMLSPSPTSSRVRDFTLSALRIGCVRTEKRGNQVIKHKPDLCALSVSLRDV